MAYKTILVHLDGSPRTEVRVRLASRIAAKQGAHLVGSSMLGISTAGFKREEMVMRDQELGKHIDFLIERAKKQTELFEEIAKQEGSVSNEGRVVDGPIIDGMVIQARYSDLVVVGQTVPGEKNNSTPSAFAEEMLLQADRPVLIVPARWNFPENLEERRALVAWDTSRGAMRAITDAIPLLQTSSKVYVAVFNANRRAVHGEIPGADLAQYLVRHDIEIEVLQRESEDIGNSLISLADEIKANLMVMGGYGTSRFKEMILGGVTRSVMKNMRVPVFMSR